MNEIIKLLNEMSPYVLLGFLLAGLMHVFIPASIYYRYLGGHSFRSVLNATLLGIPLPLCSCGVIPTAMSLYRQGASKGATISFLIATPQTGIDSIIATYSLMGLPFALVRPLAALITSLYGGILCNLTDKSRTSEPLNSPHCTPPTANKASFGKRILQALRYAYIDMMQDIGKWLILGLVIAGLITVFVPESFFALFSDNTLLSIFLVLICAIPMYLCATGSIPIAIALMLKGLSPGTAFVLLMAGPAINTASILVISKVLGRQTLFVYLFSIISGAVFFGLGIDYLFPREWFTAPLVAIKSSCNESPSFFNIGCTILLLLLLANALIRHYCHVGGCQCGSHEETCQCGSHEETCQCGCHNETEIHDKCHCNESTKPSINEQRIVIKGMTCNHCRKNVESIISSLPGVEAVTVDLLSGIALVKGKIPRESIIEAVKSIGFDVES